MDLSMRGKVQIIHACSFSPEEYASSELHRQVRAPQCCPWCGKAGVLEALGYYRRYVSASAGKVLQIGVRRFLLSVVPDHGKPAAWFRPSLPAGAKQGH